VHTKGKEQERKPQGKEQGRKSQGQGRRLHVAHFKKTLAAQSWP